MSGVDAFAVISDVHGNLTALRAVLADVRRSRAQALVVLGDLTWGPFPREALDTVYDLEIQPYLVRGNAERLILEVHDGREPDTASESWVGGAHDAEDVARLRRFDEGGSAQLGSGESIRFCHGSPRRDNELLTPAATESRLREAFADVPQSTVMHGHTHVQYHRGAAAKRIVAPGSVGLPYGVPPGTACWALVADGIELRRTAFDLAEAIAQTARSGYPGREAFMRLLAQPPPLEEIQRRAEYEQFAD